MGDFYKPLSVKKSQKGGLEYYKENAEKSKKNVECESHESPVINGRCVEGTGFMQSRII